MNRVTSTRQSSVSSLAWGLFLAGALALCGCATSPWQSDFVATAPAATLAKDAAIQLREVPWDRLQTGLRELEAEQAKSDTNAADWPESKKAEVKSKLLRTLQVQENPATVTVVGRSDFRSTKALRPESSGQEDLAAFARKVGATKVVWSRRLLGKADTIVEEPVTTYSTGFSGHRRRGDGVFSESSTAWVPIRVQADEYAYVAYFLRTSGN